MNIEVKGLPNLGNTCFMNATIQNLLACTPFNKALLRFIKNDTDQINKLDGLAAAYLKLMVNLIDTGDGIENPNPSNIKRELGIKNGKFRGYGQQDAHESLLCILDSFTDNKKNKLLDEAIGKVMYGKYMTRVKCNVCQNNQQL